MGRKWQTERERQLPVRPSMNTNDKTVAIGPAGHKYHAYYFQGIFRYLQFKFLLANYPFDSNISKNDLSIDMFMENIQAERRFKPNKKRN